VLVLASVTVNVSGRLTSHDSVGILDSVGGVGAAIGNMGVHTASQPARPPGKHDARPAKRESILWIVNHDGTREFTFHVSRIWIAIHGSGLAVVCLRNGIC
jgi:hypothetical protein